MSMRQAVLDFPHQFAFTPKIVNEQHLKRRPRIVVGGMGGSHLGADMLRTLDPTLDLFVHSDYGLPALVEQNPDQFFCIASSYSGNTEEALSFAEAALEKGVSLAVITTGGKLLQFAQDHNLPHVVMPSEGIQPRAALAFSLLGKAALVGAQQVLERLAPLKDVLNPEALQSQGKDLAQKLAGKLPVIYTSRRNFALAYNWKIKLNETGKIPAFMNVFPELNHNEMTGFDHVPVSRPISENVRVVMLSDPQDHPRNEKRMRVVQNLYEQRGVPVTMIELTGNTYEERLFNALLLADWLAIHTAEHNGAEAEQVPMVEDFKKLIAE